jgi:hypothetical protein
MENARRWSGAAVPPFTKNGYYPVISDLGVNAASDAPPPGRATTKDILSVTLIISYIPAIGVLGMVNPYSTSVEEGSSAHHVYVKGGIE